MNEMVYWYPGPSSSIQKDTYIVVELVASKTHISLRLDSNSIVSPRYVCGWSFFQVQNGENESAREVSIYEGTPRKLLYVGKGDDLETFRNALPKACSRLQFTSPTLSIGVRCGRNEATLPSELDCDRMLVKKNFIIGADYQIPGFVFNSSTRLLEYKKPSYNLNLSNISIQFASSSTSRDEFEKEIIKHVFEDEYISTIKKKSTFLQRSKRRRQKELQTQAEVLIMKRQVNFIIHNSHAVLESKVADLRVGENDTLISEETIIPFHHYWKHHLCAVICNLEYTLSIPFGVDLKSKQTDSKDSSTVKVVAGYQIFVPFDESGRTCYQDTVELFMTHAENKYHEVIASTNDTLGSSFKSRAKSNVVMIKFNHCIESRGENIDYTSEVPPYSTGTEDEENSGKPNKKIHDSLGKGGSFDDCENLREGADTNQISDKYDVKSNCSKEIYSSNQSIGSLSETESSVVISSTDERSIERRNPQSSTIRNNDCEFEYKQEGETMPSHSTQFIEIQQKESQKCLSDDKDGSKKQESPKFSELISVEATRCKLRFQVKSLQVQGCEDTSLLIGFQIFKSLEQKVEIFPNKTESFDRMKEIIHEETYDFKQNKNSKKELLKYLEDGNICIDIWSSISMIHVGMTIIPVREIVENRVSSKVFNLRRADSHFGEFGKIELGILPDICGQLEVQFSVEDDLGPTLKVLSNPKQEIDNAPYVRLLKDTNPALKSFIENVQAQVKDKARSKESSNSMGLNSKRASFFITLLERSYQGQFDTEEIESLVIQYYRSQHQYEWLQRHIQTLNLSNSIKDHSKTRVHVDVGKACHFQLVLNNTLVKPTRILITVSSPKLRELRVSSTSGNEEILAISPPPVLIGSSSNIELLQSCKNSNIIFPEKIIEEEGSYTCSVLIGGTQLVAIPLFLQVFDLDADNKEIRVTVRSMPGCEDCNIQPLLQTHRIQLTASPLPVDRTFHLCGNRDEVLTRIINTEPSLQYVSMKCISNCETESIFCESDKGKSIMLKKSWIKGGNDQNRSSSFTNDYALLVFYVDEQMLVPCQCWKFYFFGYEQVIVKSKARHWQHTILPIGKPALPQGRTFSIHTNDDDHVIINPATITSMYGKSTELKISFNYESEGEYSFIVNLVEDHNVERGWLFQVSTREKDNPTE